MKVTTDRESCIYQLYRENGQEWIVPPSARSTSWLRTKKALRAGSRTNSHPLKGRYFRFAKTMGRSGFEPLKA